MCFDTQEKLNLSPYLEEGAMGFLLPLSTILPSYIVAVSFIGEGNQCTQRKPQT